MQPPENFREWKSKLEPNNKPESERQIRTILELSSEPSQGSAVRDTIPLTECVSSSSPSIARSRAVPPKLAHSWLRAPPARSSDTAGNISSLPPYYQASPDTARS